MAKKKKKEPLIIDLTIELPDETEPPPSVVDVFAYKFLQTLSYWFGAFILIGLLGIIF